MIEWSGNVPRQEDGTDVSHELDMMHEFRVRTQNEHGQEAQGVFDFDF